MSSVHGLCQTAYMDMRRNIALKLSLVAMVFCYTAMMAFNRRTWAESVWTAYAVYSILMAFSLPLVYYVRLSDKNREIIRNVVQTKTTLGVLYEFLFDLFTTGILGATYLCMSLTAEAVLTGKEVSSHLAVSICLELAIYSLLCHTCFGAAQKYAAGLAAYLLLAVGLLISNHAFIGILCPLEYDLYVSYYVLGKFSEIIVLAALNAGIFVRKRMK